MPVSAVTLGELEVGDVVFYAWDGRLVLELVVDVRSDHRYTRVRFLGDSVISKETDDFISRVASARDAKTV